MCACQCLRSGVVTVEVALLQSVPAQWRGNCEIEESFLRWLRREPQRRMYTKSEDGCILAAWANWVCPRHGWRAVGHRVLMSSGSPWMVYTIDHQSGMPPTPCYVLTERQAEIARQVSARLGVRYTAGRVLAILQELWI